MTAMQLQPYGFGYGPARLARLESERALGRALPASFLIVVAMLLALAGVQRLAPVPRTLPGVVPDRVHEFFGRVEPLPPAGRTVFRIERPGPELGRAVVPVPDAVAPAAEPAGPASVVARGDAAADGRDGPGTGEGTGPAAMDPPPGVYVYTDELPVRVQAVPPVYPDIARAAEVEGTVLLWALVDLDGSVKAVQVIHPVPMLDEAASAAVKRWRFTPALANGHPVRVWVSVPVRFSLH